MREQTQSYDDRLTLHGIANIRHRPRLFTSRKMGRPRNLNDNKTIINEFASGAP